MKQLDGLTVAYRPQFNDAVFTFLSDGHRTPIEVKPEECYQIYYSLRSLDTKGPLPATVQRIESHGAYVDIFMWSGRKYSVSSSHMKSCIRDMMDAMLKGGY